MLIEVGVDRRDLSGNLGADLDRLHGAEGTGGGDGRLHGAALDGGGAIDWRFAAVGTLVKPTRTGERDHADRGRGKLYLVHVATLRARARRTQRDVTNSGLTL